MEYKLTLKAQFNKKHKDGKSRSYLIYFLNDVQVLKQKLPYEEDFEYGFQHRTGIEDVYLLNGRIYQTRIKFGKKRLTSFPVSKKLLKDIPNDLKIMLSV